MTHGVTPSRTFKLAVNLLLGLAVFVLGPSLVLAQGLAFVLAATPEKRVDYEPPPARPSPLGPLGIALKKPVLPMQTLQSGQVVRLAKGARLSVAVMAGAQPPHRRVYLGPARLLVRADHITVLQGNKPQVSPLPDNAIEIITQWQIWQQDQRSAPAHTGKATSAAALTLLEPKFDEVLLHRNPVLKWQGPWPRDANLVVFDGQGKRFWSQVLEVPEVEFPHTVEFEWGQTYRFEVRKATGGRVFEGQFEIASEATAKALLAERSNYLAKSLPEWRLLYAMRLHLAKAYGQAQPLWQSLGLPNPLS